MDRNKTLRQFPLTRPACPPLRTSPPPLIARNPSFLTSKFGNGKKRSNLLPPNSYSDDDSCSPLSSSPSIFSSPFFHRNDSPPSSPPPLKCPGAPKRQSIIAREEEILISRQTSHRNTIVKDELSNPFLVQPGEEKIKGKGVGEKMMEKGEMVYVFRGKKIKFPFNWSSTSTSDEEEEKEIPPKFLFPPAPTQSVTKKRNLSTAFPTPIKNDLGEGSSLNRDSDRMTGHKAAPGARPTARKEGDIFLPRKRTKT